MLALLAHHSKIVLCEPKNIIIAWLCALDGIFYRETNLSLCEDVVWTVTDEDAVPWDSLNGCLISSFFPVAIWTVGDDPATKGFFNCSASPTVEWLWEDDALSSTEIVLSVLCEPLNSGSFCESVTSCWSEH